MFSFTIRRWRDQLEEKDPFDSFATSATSVHLLTSSSLRQCIHKIKTNELDQWVCISMHGAQGDNIEMAP